MRGTARSLLLPLAELMRLLVERADMCEEVLYERQDDAEDLGDEVVDADDVADDVAEDVEADVDDVETLQRRR